MTKKKTTLQREQRQQSPKSEPSMVKGQQAPKITPTVVKLKPAKTTSAKSK